MSINEVVSTKDEPITGLDNEVTLLINVGTLSLSTSSARDEDATLYICLGGTIKAILSY